MSPTLVFLAISPAAFLEKPAVTFLWAALEYKKVLPHWVKVTRSPHHQITPQSLLQRPPKHHALRALQIGHQGPIPTAQASPRPLQGTRVQPLITESPRESPMASEQRDTQRPSLALAPALASVGKGAPCRTPRLPALPAGEPGPSTCSSGVRPYPRAVPRGLLWSLP